MGQSLAPNCIRCIPDIPKDPVIGRLYGELLVQQNRFDDAAKVDDALLKAAPSDPGLLTLHSQILVHQGKASEAISVLEQVAKNFPDNAAVHYQLGVAYAANQNLGQAETEWRQASKLQPGMTDPLRALASLAIRRGDQALLEETGGKLMMIDPRAPGGYLLHAQALLMKKDVAGAEADLNRAISVEPDHYAGYARMGDLRSVKENITKPKNIIPKRCSEIPPLRTRSKAW